MSKWNKRTGTSGISPFGGQLEAARGAAPATRAEQLHPSSCPPCRSADSGAASACRAWDSCAHLEHWDIVCGSAQTQCLSQHSRTRPKLTSLPHPRVP